MGSSSSKATATNELANNILNTSVIENVNKSIAEVGVSTLVKNANNCTSTVSQNNACNVGNINTTGAFNFNSNQSNQAEVNFGCVQASEASTDMSVAMINAIMGEVQSLSNSEAGAKLNAAANASNTTGFGSSGGSSSSSIKTGTSNNITNESYTQIQNIYEQNLKSNFTAETVSECIGKTYQNNGTNINNVNASSANIECVQTNSLKQIQECKQLQSALNKTLTNAAQELGFKIQAETATAATAAATTSSTSTNVATGPIQDIGSAISSIIDSVFGGLIGTQAASIICLIVCVCLVIASLYFAYNKMSSSELGQAASHVTNIAAEYAQNADNNRAMVESLKNLNNFPTQTTIPTAVPFEPYDQLGGYSLTSLSSKDLGCATSDIIKKYRVK